MDELAFVWESDKSTHHIRYWKMWMERYEDLWNFRQKYGDCQVPYNQREFKELSSWLKDQKWRYKKGELLKDRIVLLEDLGVVLK